MRHTHASELLSKGESVVDVARRIGDRPEVVCRVYAHFIPDDSDRLTSKLDEMYA